MLYDNKAALFNLLSTEMPPAVLAMKRGYAVGKKKKKVAWVRMLTGLQSAELAEGSCLSWHDKSHESPEKGGTAAKRTENPENP